MDDKQYQLISRYLDGKLNAAQQLKLQLWRNASPENEVRFQEVKFLWQKTKNTAQSRAPITIDVEAALKKVQQQLPETAKIIPMRRRLFQISAAASVLLFLGFFTWFSIPNQVELLAVSTAENEQKKITLPDNSVVWLNENSTITYPKHFDKATRKVEMKGDLVFEVTHNKAQPFVVHSDDLAVKVLGTKFNVISNNNNNTSSLVHVLDGKVQVAKSDLSAEIILEKGMSAALNQRDSLYLTDTFSANRLFWITHTLSFNKSTLATVFEDLRMAYAVEIEVENTELLACLFTGKFKEKTIEELFEMMEVIYDFQVEKINPKNFKIKKGTCQ